MIEIEIFDDEHLGYLKAIQDVHLSTVSHSARVPCAFCSFIDKLNAKKNTAHRQSFKITVSDLSNYTNPPNPIENVNKSDETSEGTTREESKPNGDSSP